MASSTENGTGTVLTSSEAEVIALQGGALATFARLLGPETERLARGDELALLIEILDELGYDEAASLLTQVDDDEVADAEDLSLTWTALFVRCVIPPYETSYMTGSIVGHSSELADISGFYGAFGFAPNKDRPDHLITEIEFASLLELREADAITAAEADAIEVCRNAADAFLRDHLGCWVDDFAARLAREDPINPYIPIVASLACCIEGICADRGVDVRKPATLGSPVMPGVAVDSDDMPLGCYGCSAADVEGPDSAPEVPLA